MDIGEDTETYEFEPIDMPAEAPVEVPSIEPVEAPERELEPA